MCNSNECCGDCRKCSKCEGLNIHTDEELDYIFGTLKKMRDENSIEYKNAKRNSWKIIKGDENNIIKPTWIIHGIIDEPNANGMVYHTHGMNMYDSLELELNLPIEEKVAMLVLNAIGLEIANGKNLKENEKIYGILRSPFILKKMKSISNDMEILRVIVPDTEGNFPWDKNCKDGFNKQLN